MDSFFFLLERPDAAAVDLEFVVVVAETTECVADREEVMRGHGDKERREEKRREEKKKGGKEKDHTDVI